jgi:hypothetical protein
MVVGLNYFNFQSSYVWLSNYYVSDNQVGVNSQMTLTALVVVCDGHTFR